MRIPIAYLLCLLTASALRADSFFERHAEGGATIGFAVPEIDGGISLGIYDEQGQLTRILAVDAAPDEFVKGLNGLIARWDGKDNAGKLASAGRYFARGIVVGDIRVEGEKFVGNDWVQSMNGTHVATIADLLVLPDGLLALGLTSEGKGRLVQLDRDGSPTQNIPLEQPLVPGSAPILAYGPEAEILLAAGGVTSEVDLTAGTVTASPLAGTPFDAVVAIGSRVWGRADDQLVGVAEGTEPVRAHLPSGSVLAWMELGGSLFAAPEEGGLQRLADDAWETVAGFEDFRFVAFGPSSGEGFWAAIADPEGEGALLGEFSLSGELLRSLDVGDLNIEIVDAAPDGTRVAVFGSEAGRGITRLYVREDDGTWEVALQKVIDPESGRHPGREPVSAVSVEAIENSLDPAADRTFELRPFVGDEGAYLATVDGLPLVRISDADRTETASLEPGESPGTVRFFVSEKGVSAVYRVTGLDQLERIDAGDMVLEGKLE